MKKQKAVIISFIVLALCGLSHNNLFSNSALGYLNRVLNDSNARHSGNIKRVSGGRRLLANNPLNYSLYEKLEGHMKGLDKVVANHQDMLSYYKAQAGVLGSTINILQKIRDLSIRKRSGILSDFDRSLLDSEMRQYYKQILFELKGAEFNGVRYYAKLLKSLAFGTIFKEKRFFQVNHIDRSLRFFIKQRGVLGARIKALRFRVRGKMIEKENNARFQNNQSTDFPGEMIDLRKNHLLTLANIFMLQKGLDHTKRRVSPRSR